MVELMVGNKKVQGEPVDFHVKREEWNIYTVDDVTVKVKTIVSQIFRLETVDETTGLNNYLVRSHNVVSVVEK